MSNNKTALQNLQFVMVGIILIASGNGIIDHTFLSSALVIIGILLLVYAFYSLVKRKSNFNLKLMALSCESMGLFATSYVLFNQGSKYLPYLYLVGGVAIFTGVIVHLRRRNKLTGVEIKE